MFKRSLASLAAAVVVSGAVVAPANAMTLKVNDDTTCTFNLTTEEAGVIEAPQTATITKAEAADLVPVYKDSLSDLRKEMANAEKELANPELDAAQKESLTRLLEDYKKRVVPLLENFIDALNVCVAGKHYNSDKPDAKRALSSTDGKPNEAGIGVIVAGSIVAILGILAAALPVIKPMLPAQLKALLP